MRGLWGVLYYTKTSLVCVFHFARVKRPGSVIAEEERLEGSGGRGEGEGGGGGAGEGAVIGAGGGVPVRRLEAWRHSGKGGGLGGLCWGRRRRC